MIHDYTVMGRLTGYGRRAPVGLVLLCILLSGCRPQEGVIPIADWEFRRGYDPAWFRDGSVPTDGWHHVRLPASFGEGFEYGQPAEPLEYDRAVVLRAPVPAAVRDWRRSGEPLAIYAARYGDVALFLLDDRRIGSLGQVEPYVSGRELTLLTAVPERTAASLDQLQAEEPATLYVILFESARFSSFAGRPVSIGRNDAVFAAAHWDRTLDLLLIAVYVAVGLYHLLLAIRRPRDLYNLYFGIFALTASAYWFTRSQIGRAVFDDVITALRCEYILVFGIAPPLLLFFTQLFRREHSRMALFYTVYCFVLSVIVFFGSWPVMNATLLVWQISAGAYIPYTSYYIIRETWRGHPEGRYLIAGVMLTFAATVYDILAARNVIHGQHVSHFAFGFFVVGIAGILAQRFLRVQNEVEELNADLERKVERRTHELRESLDRARALKTKQDGDYFLTSLLLRPLGGNRNRSSVTDVQILERQHKRFTFRSRDLEIGGDFCASDNIRLRGRPYTLFLNGDAMGKSVQGAGGALVLGTVFQSIVDRTSRSRRMMKLYPEVWLRDCYKDLQNVFVTFDGSMLVSFIVGLVEDDTGMLYWLNADHPRLVLLRAGRASFLQDDVSLLKAGVQIFDGNRLRIHTARMEPDDVILSGSDGRDDVLVGYDERDLRVLNEDPTAFLRSVEAGRGFLPAIERDLRRRGELTDDLSLMRIAWREDFAGNATYADERREEERRRAHLSELFDRKRYSEFLHLVHQYAALYSEDTELVYMTARAFAATGKHGPAKEHARRFLLRDRPDLRRSS